LITVEPEKREQAILVGVVQNDQTHEEVEEYINELALLADTAHVDVLSKEIQDRKAIDPAFFIGKGKADYLSLLVKELKANIIIFDDDLSTAQARNLEKRCGVKIIDRSALILDIFARRAKTKEAKTQVELAQLQYLLPRLTRMWTHLSRQVGGAGIGLRGPGEKQLEVDRRLIQKRIAVLQEQLKKIGKQQDIRRQQRTNLFKVALMGYTNVGKSTLLNALTSSEVFVEDRLFATLDATVRRLNTKNGLDILLIDTVGFIRKLPHHLIASFKSTLQETREADLLLHIIDISSPIFREQIKVVQSVLVDLKISDKPILYVFNKVDLLKNKELLHAATNEFTPNVVVSATRGIFLTELENKIKQMAADNYLLLDLKIDITRQREIALLHSIAKVLEKEYVDGYVNIKLQLNRSKYSSIEHLLHEQQEQTCP